MADTTAAIFNNSKFVNLINPNWSFYESEAADFTISGTASGKQIQIINTNDTASELLKSQSKSLKQIFVRTTSNGNAVFSPSAKYATQGRGISPYLLTFRAAVNVDFTPWFFKINVFCNTVLTDTIQVNNDNYESAITGNFNTYGQILNLPTNKEITFSIEISCTSGDEGMGVYFDCFGLCQLDSENLNNLPQYSEPILLRQTQGIYRYGNSLPAQSITGGAWTTINNNGLAAETYKNRIFGVSELWNTSTNRGDVSGLELGDTVEFSFEADLTTTTANDIAEMRLILAQGTASERTRVLFSESDFKTAGTRTISGRAQIVLSDNDVKNNPFRVELRTGANSTFLTKNFLVIAQKTRIPC